MGYLLGVIGNPAKHSLSPWIHEQFLRLSKLNGIYRSYEVHENELFMFLNSLKKMDVDGFNITVPYKEKIINYLDEIDDSARHVGAVNTVVNRDGKWIGYNTDGEGYIKSLKHTYPEAMIDVETKKVLIIGAGGASRGIYYGLNQNGFQFIDLANRTQARAEMVREIKKSHVSTNVLSLEEAEVQADQYDIIIQTTNLGMTPNIEIFPLKLKKLKENAILSDIIYKPIETQLLKTGKRLGAKIHFGHGMLLHQAALSFQFWTDVEIDPTPLLNRLETKLR